MHKKTVTLLAGGAGMCVLFGAYFALKTGNERAEQKASEETQKEKIVNVDSDKITTLSFEIGEEEAVFQRDGEEWSYAADSTFPVNPAQINSVLGCLTPLEAERTLEDITDTTEYGMDEPQNVVRVTDEDGTETVVTIGDTNSGTGNDYVMLNEDQKVIYTTGTSLRESVSKELLDFASADDIPYVMASAITEVSVVQGEEEKRFYLDDDTWREEGDEDTETEAEAEAETDAETETEIDAETETEIDAETETETEAGTETDAETETEAGTEEETETETETEAESETEGPSGMTSTEIQTAVSSMSGISYLDYIEYNCENPQEYGLGDDAAKLTIVYEEEAEEETGKDSDDQTENDIESETESETEAEPEMVRRELTFYVGDVDENGNYYVQLEGSVQVHTISAAVISPFIG